MPQPPTRKRLGEILMAEGLLDSEQLEEALGSQTFDGHRHRLGNTVIRLGFATEDDVAKALGRQLGYATVDLAEVAPDTSATRLVSRQMAQKHQALPLRLENGDQLVVAMSDPTNVVALDDLRMSSGAKTVRPLVATHSALAEAINRTYGGDIASSVVDNLRDARVVTLEEESLDDLAEAARGADEQPVIRLANAILADAVRSRTSDVHVEPYRDAVRVRYRIDGQLRETMRVPRHVAASLVSRLKIMSQLDIAERRLPQDGRAMVRVEGQEVDLRVSTMPTMYGETVVLRLLRKGAQRMLLDDLNMADHAREPFERALERPQGLIVITGPTGSGKTTTLYAGLTELADPVRNIITLEDPIEYQLDGVNQSQVNPKIGLTFARGLRTTLRQDPDVVMVGEIRDRETAELALEASMTGHLVLSTLHTNDAPASIVRLVDLGVERFLIASSLLLVIAQRLVRVTCDHCAAPYEPEDRDLRLLGLTRDDIRGLHLLKGTGCQLCEGSGFRGRMAVYEVLRVTANMRELVIEGAPETAVSTLARSQGMWTMREDALRRAFSGLTTLAEVARMTPDEPVHVARLLSGLEDAPTWPAPAEGNLEPSAQKKKQKKKSVPAPVTVAPSTDVAAALQELEAVTVTSQGRPRPEAPVIGARKPTVLIVEDDDSVRNLIATVLDEDYLVLEASDAEGAFKMVGEHDPDAVILDYKLPDLDGIEVTRLFREEGIGREVPIIMLTGVSDPATEVEGLLAGVTDYLTKPFEVDVLLMRLRMAIERSSRT